MRRAVLLLAAMGVAPALAAAQVDEQIVAALSTVERALQRSFARALPLPAPSAGVAYSFDAESGTFQRDPATFGQVYLERADPLGAGRVNLSVVYQYVALEKLSGHDVGALRNRAPIPLTDYLAAVDMPRLDLTTDVQEVLLAATYGITDALEASLALPLIYSRLSATAPVSAAALSPEGELVLIDERIDQDDSSFGVGDVMLRGKYRFAALDDVHLAAGLLVRLPSGNESDLQGIGFVEVTPALIASTRVFTLAPWARLQGHFNGGIDFDTEDVDASDARWGIGLDWGVSEHVTAAIAFLAQNQFARVAPPGTFTVPQCQADVVTCAIDPAVRVGTQQLFGLSGDRVDYYTLSIGGRAGLWRDTLFGIVNVAIPLNDGFVRTAPIPLIGLEATF